MRLYLFAGLALWVGLALLLSRVRWFARSPLTDRLRRYAPGGFSTPARSGVPSVETFRDVIGPLSAEVGERMSRLLGVDDDLATRLARIHSPVDATSYRVRQVGWSVGGFAAGTLVGVALPVPVPLAILLIVGTPLLAFLVLEQQVARASAAWQRRIFLELPVISEQIGMLLSAGYSLGSSLNRIAARSYGACGRDLIQVGSRVRQGLSEVEALREWAALAQVDALDRLVGVLSLNREAGDLGRLIAEEARSIRRDVQRELVEKIERRGQQVWIPVTVATLVPGVIFLAVPFIEAMRLFSA